MSRLHRNATLAGVVLPFVAFAAGVVSLWNEMVSVTDLLIMAVMYVLTGLGVTVGYHRLFTHRAFHAPAAVRYTLAVLGSMAVQGAIGDWVADHRKHHAHTDREGDPHSPHGHGDGLLGALRGLWYAHMGWLVDTQGAADKARFAPEIADDPRLRRIDRGFPLLVALGLAIPFAVGWAIGGTLGAGLSALLWGGLVRVFFLHHVTWSINSVCHFAGARRFATEDRSTNVFWLAVPSFGEAWHHNHHAFPRSAVHGLRRRELDPSSWVIAALERLGLATNVIRISPERQRQRLT